MATGGYLNMAISGYFSMATDSDDAEEHLDQVERRLACWVT